MVDRPPTPVPPDVSRALLLELSRPRTTQDCKYRELQPYKKSRWRDFAFNKTPSAYPTWAKYAMWCVTSILKELRDRHLRRRRLSREVHANKLRAPPGRVKGLKEAFSRSLMAPRNGHCIIHPLCWFNAKGVSYIPEGFRVSPLRDREEKDPTGDRSKPSVSSTLQVTPVSLPAPPKYHSTQTAATGAVHGAVPRVPRPQPRLERGAATSVKPPTAPRRIPPVSCTRTKPPRKPPSDAEFAEAFIKGLQIELSSFEARMVRREALLQVELAESVTQATRKREESPPVRIPKPKYSLMKDGPPRARPNPGGAGPSWGSEEEWTVPGWYQPAQPTPRPPAPRAGGFGWAARTRERRSTAAWRNCPCNSHPNRLQPPTQPATNRPTYFIYVPPDQFKDLAAAFSKCSTNEDLSENKEDERMTLEEVLEVCKITEDLNENTENDKTQHAEGAANEQSGQRRRRRRRRRGKKAAEGANPEQQQQQ